MRLAFAMLIHFTFTMVFDRLGSHEQQQRGGNIHIPKSQALCICQLLTLPIMRLPKEKKTKQLLQNWWSLFSSSLAPHGQLQGLLKSFPVIRISFPWFSQEPSKPTNKVLLVYPVTKLAIYFCGHPQFANLVEIV